jgi:hypothetical protein
MTRRFLLPVAAALTMVVAPAMAAQMTEAALMAGTEKCTALEQQFDHAIVKHTKDAKAADARTLRTDGGKLCVSGNTDQGTKKLQQALNDIGVKPTY